MSAAIQSNGTLSAFNVYGPMLDQYSNYFGKLMRGNPIYSGEDLKQALIVKFIICFTSVAKWEKVKNKKAYVATAARNLARTYWNLTHAHDSLEDREEVAKRKDTDEGHFCSQMKEKIDLEALNSLMRSVLGGFSTYNQKIIELSFFEKCPPRLITEILIKEQPEMLNEIFPEAWAKPEKERFGVLKLYISYECIKVRSNFSRKLLKTLKDNGYDIDKLPNK